MVIILRLALFANTIITLVGLPAADHLIIPHYAHRRGGNERYGILTTPRAATKARAKLDMVEATA
jgi:hypothetical protein